MLEKGERRLREIEYLKNLAKPITASELGTMFGVCRTTAQQDILALQDWGCEFERRSGNSGGYILTRVPDRLEFVLKDTQIEIWNSIYERCDAEERRVLAYVMSIAEQNKLSK